MFPPISTWRGATAASLRWPGVLAPAAGLQSTGPGDPPTLISRSWRSTWPRPAFWHLKLNLGGSAGLLPPCWASPSPGDRRRPGPRAHAAACRWCCGRSRAGLDSGPDVPFLPTVDDKQATGYTGRSPIPHCMARIRFTCLLAISARVKGRRHARCHHAGRPSSLAWYDRYGGRILLNSALVTVG